MEQTLHTRIGSKGHDKLDRDDRANRESVKDGVWG